jgi:hypothetical protein
MTYSWKTSFVAIGVLGLLAALTVPNAMAAGHGHSGRGGHGHSGAAGHGHSGIHSMRGHPGRSNHFGTGRFGGRYRDFGRSWYGNRYGRYGYGFYSGYGWPLYPYYSSCYQACCPSCCLSNPLCSECTASCPGCLSCDSPSYGFNDYCGGCDSYGRPYRLHRDRDGRLGDRGGEHRLGSVIGHGNSRGMASHVASSGAHGSRR